MIVMVENYYSIVQNAVVQTRQNFLQLEECAVTCEKRPMELVQSLQTVINQDLQISMQDIYTLNNKWPFGAKRRKDETIYFGQ